MNKVVWGARIRLGALVLVTLVGSASCGDMVRQGQASSYLIIDRLQGGSGQGGTLGDVVSSDVVTVVSGVPTIFADPGSVTMRVAMKDVTSPTSPSTNNAITINRYRVRYIRADGRNTEGVDVPYTFDGAVTATIPAGGSVTFGFTLVRIQAKMEAPLAALAVNGNTISTIAQVTFYGRDQTGRETSVTGQISINFANWGD